MPAPLTPPTPRPTPTRRRGLPSPPPADAAPADEEPGLLRRGRAHPVVQHSSTSPAPRLTALPGGSTGSSTSPSGLTPARRAARARADGTPTAPPLHPATDIEHWTGNAPKGAPDAAAAADADRVLNAGPQPWRPPGAGRAGSIRRDPTRGTWTVRVETTGYTDNRRRQLQRRGFATERDARIALTEILAAQDSGSYQRIDPDVTLAAYTAEHWMPALRTKGRKPSTLESYQRNLDVHVLPRIGHWPLASVTPAALNALYAALLAGGPRRRPLAPRTVRYIHTILHGVYAHAARRDLVTVNPTGRADPPEHRACRAETRPTWTPEQLQQFIARLNGDPIGPPLLLLATTGMRRGEALALRWDDVDLDAGEIIVRRSLGRVGTRLVETDPKTSAGRRRIILDTFTTDVLRAHRTEQARRQLRAGPGWHDDGYLFTLPDGQPFHPDNFSKAYRYRVRVSGLPPIRLHDLRHTWASLALQAGIHPKIVQERLGHASIAITLDLYTHTDRASHAHAASAVAALVTPLPRL